MKAVLSFFRLRWYSLSLVILFITAFLLRAAFGLSENFLHDWDERFHALVARNMMDQPFQPMLYRRLYLPYDPHLWCCNHIWLHKQPLFLWQMAGSMNLFGVSEWSMRFPSIVMGSVLVLITARIALLVTAKKTIAILSAVLLCFSSFHLELISGIEGMDHNDVALGFYALASVWSFAEYRRSGKWYWAVLTGLFAGCAVLNKWLVGLFVYLGWGITWILNWYHTKKPDLRQGRHFLLSLALCGLVFIPWQLYILYRWPDLARYEYDFNRRHITEALEGHSGSVWYYVRYASDFFGSWLGLLVLPGVYLGFYRKYINRELYIALISGMLFVFCFFSFLVKTKVQSHFFFIVPLCMILISLTVYEWVVKYRRWYLTALVPVLFVTLSFKPGRAYQYFYGQNIERERKQHNTAIFNSMGEELRDVDVVMNLNSFENIEFMFYHNHITAHDYPLSPEDLNRLAKDHIRIGVFRLRSRPLPDYVRQYPYLKQFRQELY